MKNVIDYSREEAYIGTLAGKVTLPSDYDKEKDRLPVIIFLHGAGERGNGRDELDKVRVHGIPKYFCDDPDYKGLRVITASPQCPEGLIWDNITLQLMDWIKAVVKEYNGDESRINICGISMGGFGTWNMLSTFPTFFNKAAPVCGGGVAWRIGEKYKGKQIRVYHSVDDPDVLYEYSVIMAKRARLCGADISFTTYTDKGHGCWVAAFEDSDLIEWLSE